MQAWRIREASSVKYAIKNTADLSSDAWVLVPNDLINAYNKLLAQSIKLINLVGEDNIFNGIQTSENEVYVFFPIKEDATYYYFEKSGVNYKIEKDFALE